MYKSAAPIFEAVSEYIRRSPSRFHMPGHAGISDVLSVFRGMLPFDVTEVEGLDALFEASGCILASEKLAADQFGAKRTLYSTGGSTLAIQTMLGLAATGGGRVIFGRNLHRSALNACFLLGIDPVFVFPDSEGFISDAEIRRALSETPDAKAVYLTSPDYFGRLLDLRPISAVCRAFHVPLLVDSAHGAHLRFVDPALSPLEQGASMAACSAHKTLPVLTSGAMLHIADERYVGDAKRVMSLFGSTSPSYPVLISLDLCRAWLEESGIQAFSALCEQTKRLKEHARSLGLFPLDGKTDPVRFTLETAQNGVSGLEAAKSFRGCGCEPEYADDRFVVFILTPFHTAGDFQRLRAALASFAAALSHTVQKVMKPAEKFSDLEKCCTLREAMLAPAEIVDTRESVGKIAAETACPCPPGIPVVVPGEKISENAALSLIFYGVYSIKVVK